jgi:6-phosphogluconate dehydrogenase
MFPVADASIPLGIEYGDMQLIAEAYDILKRGLGCHEAEIATIFEKWNKGVLDSFLIEITAAILRFLDDDGEALVSKILDQAGQKGTGKWTAINALDTGCPGKSLQSIGSRMVTQILPM